MTAISAQEARNHPNAFIVDVRTPLEHSEVHVADAVLLPLSELQPAKVTEMAAGRPIHVLCRSGNRARKAAEQMTAAGIANVAVIEGGIEAWIAAGLPVTRGKKVMSLERQVRVAAGTLVLVGTVLGFWLHPGFYAIPAFVGCGLIFAGITDWCGMGLLIARMPWNQAKPAACDKPACSASNTGS